MLAGKSRGIGFSQVRLIGHQVGFDTRLGQLYIELSNTHLK